MNVNADNLNVEFSKWDGKPQISFSSRPSGETGVDVIPELEGVGIISDTDRRVVSYADLNKKALEVLGKDSEPSKLKSNMGHIASEMRAIGKGLLQSLKGNVADVSVVSLIFQIGQQVREIEEINRFQEQETKADASSVALLQKKESQNEKTVEHLKLLLEDIGIAKRIIPPNLALPEETAKSMEAQCHRLLEALDPVYFFERSNLVMASSISSELQSFGIEIATAKSMSPGFVGGVLERLDKMKQSIDEQLKELTVAHERFLKEQLGKFSPQKQAELEFSIRLQILKAREKFDSEWRAEVISACAKMYEQMNPIDKQLFQKSFEARSVDILKVGLQNTSDTLTDFNKAIQRKKSQGEEVFLNQEDRNIVLGLMRTIGSKAGAGVLTKSGLLNEMEAKELAFQLPKDMDEIVVSVLTEAIKSLNVDFGARTPATIQQFLGVIKNLPISPEACEELNFGLKAMVNEVEESRQLISEAIETREIEQASERSRAIDDRQLRKWQRNTQAPLTTIEEVPEPKAEETKPKIEESS